jgi:hypothetical protein
LRASYLYFAKEKTTVDNGGLLCPKTNRCGQTGKHYDEPSKISQERLQEEILGPIKIRLINCQWNIILAFGNSNPSELVKRGAFWYRNFPCHLQHKSTYIWKQGTSYYLSKNAGKCITIFVMSEDYYYKATSIGTRTMSSICR